MIAYMRVDLCNDKSQFRTPHTHRIYTKTIRIQVIVQVYAAFDLLTSANPFWNRGMDPVGVCVCVCVLSCFRDLWLQWRLISTKCLCVCV